MHQYTMQISVNGGLQTHSEGLQAKLRIYTSLLPSDTHTHTGTCVRKLELLSVQSHYNPQPDGHQQSGSVAEDLGGVSCSVPRR